MGESFSFYIQNPKDGLNVVCFDVFIREMCYRKLYSERQHDSSCRGKLSAFASFYPEDNIHFTGPKFLCFPISRTSEISGFLFYMSKIKYILSTHLLNVH